MNLEFLRMSKVRLYLTLADDDTIRPWVKDDVPNISHYPARVPTGDPEIDALTNSESDNFYSAQKWLSQKRPLLKRVICDEWKYCSRRAEYDENYERLVKDMAKQITGIVGVHLAELVAAILFKESLFSLCECGDIKRLMQEAIDSYEQKRYDDYTLGLFANIAEIDPDNHRAYYYQGIIKLKSHLYEEAISFYKKAMVLSPTDPVYLNDLGYVYAYVKKDLKTAKDYVALALRMVGNDPYNRSACLDSLGWVLCQLGEYTEALKFLSESLEFVRQKVDNVGVEILQEVLYHIAETYRGLGDKKKLEKTIAEIQKLNPQSVWAEKAKSLHFN